MKCRYCGIELEKGVFFCPSCGKEVQWVPEYNALENLLEQQRLAEEKQRKKALEAQKEQERLRRQTELEKKKKAKKRNQILWLGAIAAAAAAGVLFFISRSQSNSFDFQMAKAETKFSNRDYEGAYEYVERALTLQPENPEANVLEAKIRLKEGNKEAALLILESVIENSPGSISAYGELLPLYEEEGEIEKIQLLMEQASDEIRMVYKKYVCSMPEVSLEGGTYEEELEVGFEKLPEGVEVYYTLNGTKPTKDSSRYCGVPILLTEEGETKLRYAAYNELGISSEIGEQTYRIAYQPPKTPVIEPVSGKYTVGSLITVIVPYGCTAYYSFDGTASKETGTLYTKPVPMPYGETLFSVVAVNEKGKESRAVSEAYVCYAW